MTATTTLPPDPRLEGTLSVLSPSGELLRPDLVPDEDTLLKLYVGMRRARIFDDRAMVLQRQGKLGVYPCFGGMEATQVGAALALEDGDWVLPTYRGSALAMLRGLPLDKLLLCWRGHPAGYEVSRDLHLLPFYIPIANQIPHTAGIALSEKRRGTGRVAMAFIGDGGTSEGDFHVGVNFAGAFGAPAIFVIENNGWAISTPTRVQTAAKNLASRAEGYGMPGVRVDGNDVLAMYHVTRDAAARARRGEGPSLSRRSPTASCRTPAVTTRGATARKPKRRPGNWGATLASASGLIWKAGGCGLMSRNRASSRPPRPRSKRRWPKLTGPPRLSPKPCWSISTPSRWQK